MKNKKVLLVISLAIIFIVGIAIYSNTPTMKTISDQPNWKYEVMKDKKNSAELQGVLSQKNKNDKMEIVSFYIKETSSDKQVVTYTNKEVKAGLTEENYKNEKNPIFLEFPLGNTLDKGTEYSLILKYTINDEVKVDEIKFK